MVVCMEVSVLDWSHRGVCCGGARVFRIFGEEEWAVAVDVCSGSMML